MKRPLQATLATAAVASVAIVAPIVAYAASSSAPAPAACAPQQSAVDAARALVEKDTKALAAAGKAAHRRTVVVSKAQRKLKKAQVALDAAQGALTDCSVLNQPRPTVTATATATTTTTATTTASPTATPAPLTFTMGTARLSEVGPDLSAIPAIGTWDGVDLGGTGFGSAFTADPDNSGYFYGLTDRGPNVTAPDGSAKLEPMAGFQDQIGWFHQVAGTMQLVKTIGLTLPDGKAMSGLVNTEAGTGETIIDQYGNTLPKAASGLDTEGLVAMEDGTFWVSDEYGPFVVHVDANGKELERYDPYVTAAGTSTVFGDQVYPLPGELKKRRPNRGMEGLTITPNGQYLVGVMQSPLEKNGATAPSSAKGAVDRIVKINLATHAVQEYLYTQHNAAGNAAGEAVSEITALSDTTFILDERDGLVSGLDSSGNPKATKNLFKIDLTGATDVGPQSPLVTAGAATYDATTGLKVGGKTIEELTDSMSGDGARAALTTAGVTVGAESLYLNYAGLVSAIDRTGMYFGHDKVEGVAIDPTDPNRVYISNDSDFGITDLPKTGTNPNPADGDTRAIGTGAQKFLPDGRTQDFGEVLLVDLSQVPAAYRG